MRGCGDLWSQGKAPRARPDDGRCSPSPLRCGCGLEIRPLCPLGVLFRALGIEFVSLSEQIHTSTLMGKMVFTVLGAVAELERSLIVERVKAGLRSARAKGKRLGRPRKVVDATRITILRARALLAGDRIGKRGSARGQPSGRFLAAQKRMNCLGRRF